MNSTHARSAQGTTPTDHGKSRVHRTLRLARAIIGLALLIAASLGPSTHAQVSASISGFVSDPSGAAVPSANVTVTDTETGVSRTASSDGVGRYLIVALPVGLYEVKVSKPGFQESTRQLRRIPAGFEPDFRGDCPGPCASSGSAQRAAVAESLANASQWFNPAAFIAPPSASGFYGTAGRDTFMGPGLATWDFSVLKDTAISERLQLQFRAAIFNLLNRANFNTPNLIVFTPPTATNPTGLSGTAGAITGTATTARQLQIALKLLW
jgi:hypothetical protein